MLRTAIALSALLAVPAGLGAQNFGSAVTAGGGDLLVGEPLNEYVPGLVHVYRRDGGAWRAVAELRAADGRPLDRFGRSLSAEGGVLLVGATAADSGRGAAYVFERDPRGAWRQAARLAPAGARDGDAWGRTVLLHGGRAFVASWGRRGSGWAQEAELVPRDAAPGDFAGTSLAAHGNLLVVGAAQKDSARGAAWVFRRDAAGGWREEARLAGQGLGRNSRFGAAAAIVGPAVVIGAPGTTAAAGTIHVFRHEAGAWTGGAPVTAPDASRQAQFGAALAAGDGHLWVGAPGADRTGAVYRFTPAADGSLRAAGRLGHPDAGRGDLLGAALAPADDHILVGSPGDDHGAGTAVILGTSGDAPAAKLWGEVRGPAAVTGGKVECGQGTAAVFACGDVDLLAFLPIPAIGGGRGVQLNDVWGWTDPATGREYALVGRVDGTSFVDVTDPVNPRYLGDLPKTAASPASAWRDIKVYRDHAFVVADLADAHGMQVFDLTRLRGVTAPQTFAPDAVYDRIHSAHNIVIDTTAGLAFAVGASSGGETCGGALHMIDIREPRRPAFAGCFADPATGLARTGYTHDAQCVRYAGPDSTWRGRHVCFNASETAVGIADVTDPSAPRAISRVTYPAVAYTHQGWLTEDHRWFLVNDEGDESAGLTPGTRTLIFDVSDLDDPVFVRAYVAPNRAIDHNLYIHGNLMYQSNYASGLRILDVSDPANPRPAGFFDTRPVGPDEPEFTGSWSNYPFFRSGTIVVTSIGEGLFLLRRSSRPLVP
jgi:choice-of-anchor B domain-containing protein